MSDGPAFRRNLLHTDDDSDEIDFNDNASQRSISLSTPTTSPRNSTIDLADDDHNDAYDPHSVLPVRAEPDSPGKRASKPYTLDTDQSSEPDDDLFHRDQVRDSPDSSAAPSVFDEPKAVTSYPPPPADTESLAESFTSGSSRKARPESMLVLPQTGPLVLGIALVDFNHLVGPRIEWSKGAIFEDEEVVKIIPFLALPDGAHLSAEDYSYFHLVPSGPNPTTVFGISCNQQIAASSLLVKLPDVTRSTVQKAVVVLASKPVFGPIRDKLGVVTTALFNQKDFSELQILDDFEAALEPSLRGQLTESGLYMGTNLRELVHTFRQRTLILVKALILQKRIMFYGHPVERLCTYQYSLISLLPGLLQTLEDCGSPPLAARAPTLSRPTSLRTSDRKSMMAYTGLPLDIFGKDAFFQPYLPLQQMDMLKETRSWLVGSTNSIVTQQAGVDLVVNTETGLFEFRDPKLERAAGLTAADRKWMDDIVTDVNEGWDEEDPMRGTGVQIQFKGSDDYLRTKFEEYISAALASVRYRDFVAKGEGGGVIITGGTGGDATSTEDFNPLWISEFKNTNAYEVWERTTDPMLFDIIEPRHPCTEKPSVVTDIGIRLQEGIQELKLEQQLAPAREAVAVASANFFKAVEGVRGRWMQRSASSTSTGSGDGGSAKDGGGGSEDGKPVVISKADLVGEEEEVATAKPGVGVGARTSVPPIATPTKRASSAAAAVVESPRQTFAAWGSGISGAFATRFGRGSASASPASSPVDGGGGEGLSRTVTRGSVGSVTRGSVGSVVGGSVGSVVGSPVRSSVSPEAGSKASRVLGTSTSTSPQVLGSGTAPLVGSRTSVLGSGTTASPQVLGSTTASPQVLGTTASPQALGASPLVLGSGTSPLVLGSGTSPLVSGGDASPQVLAKAPPLSKTAEDGEGEGEGEGEAYYEPGVAM